jgi:hypothetical protein
MDKMREAMPPFEYVAASICKMHAVIAQIKQRINYSWRMSRVRGLSGVPSDSFCMVDGNLLYCRLV